MYEGSQSNELEGHGSVIFGSKAASFAIFSLKSWPGMPMFLGIQTKMTIVLCLPREESVRRKTAMPFVLPGFRL